MQNKHQNFFFSFGGPNFGGGGGGSTWLGQIPKFFQKLDLKASLITKQIIPVFGEQSYHQHYKMFEIGSWFCEFVCRGQ